jgi:hypothetical protein
MVTTGNAYSGVKPILSRANVTRHHPERTITALGASRRTDPALSMDVS